MEVKGKIYRGQGSLGEGKGWNRCNDTGDRSHCWRCQGRVGYQKGIHLSDERNGEKTSVWSEIRRYERTFLLLVE